jgi:hypothetical protein
MWVGRSGEGQIECVLTIQWEIAKYARNREYMIGMVISSHLL